MELLDHQGETLLRYLANYMRQGRFAPANPVTYVTYGRALEELGLERERGESHGRALQRQGLNNLAHWAHDHEHPALTGLIVEEAGHMPSHGYWELYEKEIADSGLPATEWWHEEIRRTLRFDWSEFLGESPRPFDPPEAGDIGNPEPGRVDYKATRIIRDTRVAELVKHWYNNQCQVCKQTFMIDKHRSYSEGHHVHPLGAEIPGPDIVENVLCVCPGCHVRLDFRGARLHRDELLLDTRHKVGQQFIDYHNEHLAPEIF